jgi:hypothetical protein
LTAQEQKAETVTASVGKLTSVMADLQERFEDISESLSLKTEGDEGSSGSHVVKLKEGIKVLKEQIKNMGMDIALLNHTLLSQRQHLSRAQYNRQLSLRKAKKASRRGEASTLSDEDLDLD